MFFWDNELSWVGFFRQHIFLISQETVTCFFKIKGSFLVPFILLFNCSPTQIILWINVVTVSFKFYCTCKCYHFYLMFRGIICDALSGTVEIGVLLAIDLNSWIVIKSFLSWWSLLIFEICQNASESWCTVELQTIWQEHYLFRAP